MGLRGTRHIRANGKSAAWENIPRRGLQTAVVPDTTPNMEPHKRLQSWLDAAKITKAEMARRCGYDRSNFQRVVNGTLTPSLNLAAAIERETGNAIPAIAWATSPTPDAQVAA